MTWVPWLYSAALIVNAIACVKMSWYCRDMRKRNDELRFRLAVTQQFLDALLERTNGMVVCDGCGKAIVEEQPAAVRITPTGPVFGHVMCLPPMPEQS